MEEWQDYVYDWVIYREDHDKYFQQPNGCNCMHNCHKSCNTQSTRNVVELKSSHFVSYYEDIDIKSTPPRSNDTLVYNLRQPIFKQCIFSILGIACSNNKLEECSKALYLGDNNPTSGELFAVSPLNSNDIYELGKTAQHYSSLFSKPYAFVDLQLGYLILVIEKDYFAQQKHIFIILNAESIDHDRIFFSNSTTSEVETSNDRTSSQDNQCFSLFRSDQLCQFQTPSGLNWEDIMMKFLDGHTLRVNAGDRTGVFSYPQMGMQNHSNGNFNEQWRLLQKLAKYGGELGSKNCDLNYTLKKHKQRLSKVLCKFFEMQTSPIHWNRLTRSYCCRFRIFAEDSEDGEED